MIDIIVTQAGRAALINADNTGTLPVLITQIGLSATAVTPTEAATTLPGELKRVASIAGEVVAADTIHVSLLDESTDAYTLRSLALYLPDGTLFAIGGQADPILIKTAASIAAAAIDVVFADISATSVTFGDATFSNPPATTERQGVVELATVAEAQAGLDALRALTPESAKAAVLGWLLAQDGAGSGLDADLLDGQNGSWYADVPARLGYTPANRAGDTFSGAIRRDPNFYLDLSSGNPIIALDTNDYLQWSRATNLIDLFIGGSSGRLWNALNDGAGSGLDADLLDGLNANQFLRIVSLSLGTDGYIESSHALLANNLWLKWKTVTVTPAAGLAFTWPGGAFANAIFGHFTGGLVTGAGSGSYSFYLSARSLSGGTAWGNNGASQSSTITIFALGN